MKTIEELEALVETLTRERDLSLFAWESAGMTGRDAQSAMLELARQLDEHREKRSMYAAECVSLRARLADAQRERDEARETIVALTTAKAEADLEIATLTAALDERDVEAERGLEQYDRLVRRTSHRPPRRGSCEEATRRTGRASSPASSCGASRPCVRSDPDGSARRRGHGVVPGAPAVASCGYAGRTSALQRLALLRGLPGGDDLTSVEDLELQQAV